MAKITKIAQHGKIKALVYKRADEFGYLTSGRKESGQFMDDLVEDPEIGGVLNEYMTKERIRTYIKDGILNAYTKARNKKVLSATTPENVVKQLYNCEANVIQKGTGKESDLYVLRSTEGKIFVVSGGTVFKWETALRKALEIIAREPGLTIDSQTPFICLKLSEASQVLTDADKEHIRTALNAIRVKAIFCGPNSC